MGIYRTLFFTCSITLFGFYTVGAQEKLNEKDSFVKVPVAIGSDAEAVVEDFNGDGLEDMVVLAKKPYSREGNIYFINNIMTENNEPFHFATIPMIPNSGSVLKKVYDDKNKVFNLVVGANGSGSDNRNLLLYRFENDGTGNFKSVERFNN